MTTHVVQTSERTEGSGGAKAKTTIVHKYIHRNLKTPIEVLNQNGGKNLPVFDNYYLSILIRQAKLQYELWFLKKYPKYIDGAIERIEELEGGDLDKDIDNIQDVISKFITRADELAELMEGGKEPKFCITEAVMLNALELTKCQIEVNLLRRYHEKLRDGKELLLEAEEAFEAIGSKLKIGRRTKGGMRKKGGDSNTPKE